MDLAVAGASPRAAAGRDAPGGSPTQFSSQSGTSGRIASWPVAHNRVSRSRARAAFGELAHAQLLAKAFTDNAVQRDGRSCAGAAHRLLAGRSTAVDANCRPPVRRCDCAAGRASYEAATPWRSRRPSLDAGSVFTTELPSVPEPATPEISAARCDELAAICRRAGLTPNERVFRQLCATAPYVDAMVARLRRDPQFYDEPASTFSPVQAVLP